ncbi:MAG: response regulator transcription factor [Ignavibacteriales bacterium]|nr:response regulator transcription factor [Ignavibacteriales bacterium]MCF8305413.1 response regulator transcription factor [Ignavibacteriales bacterium]MCF8316096.1 response regulator transcription factor [Ignavibacteriales bacterium]MCF8436598.1 response regulator transcription factor [Ignavibacteriales bacterium]
MKILIVDDNPKIRNMLRDIMQGDELSECNDGDQVLAQIISSKPDLILMDIRMKRKNGFQTTKEVKLSYPEIPVFFVTNYTDPELIEEARLSGASGLIPKENIYSLKNLFTNPDYAESIKANNTGYVF